MLWQGWQGRSRASKDALAAADDATRELRHAVEDLERSALTGIVLSDRVVRLAEQARRDVNLP